MNILSIQKELVFDKYDIARHDGTCNHPNIIEAYHKLFDDYNKKFNTSYKNFFFGFSKLKMDRDTIPILPMNIIRAIGMIGSKGEVVAYWLDIPEEVLMESNFYSFTDYCYNIQFPKEKLFENLDWDKVLYDETLDVEKQVIFPYIKKEWIKGKVGPFTANFPSISDIIKFEPYKFDRETESLSNVSNLLYRMATCPFIIPTVNTEIAKVEP